VIKLDKAKEKKLRELEKAKYSTSDMAKYFGVGQRTVQIWLKKLGLNRSLSKASKISNRKRKISIKEAKCLKKKNKRFPNINGDYCLYRFIDKNGKVLYLGKCEKSINSNGRGGKRIYFLSERMNQHYAPMSKHLPKVVYENTCIIEYALCKSQNELRLLEGNMILDYKLKGECMWNGHFANEINPKYDSSKLEWILYTQFNDIELES
jgi:excinuclease UvrABC nuclease subunit